MNTKRTDGQHSTRLPAIIRLTMSSARPRDGDKHERRRRQRCKGKARQEFGMRRVLLPLLLLLVVMALC
ncbi:MAG: hypothetical protein E5V86_34185, partial [Mesorhizobium sp.]